MYHTLKTFIFLILYLILYFHRICFRTVSTSYHYQFSELKFSKATRYILKVKQDSDRARFALSENILTLNICRLVFESFDSKILLKYDSGTETYSMEAQYKLGPN